MPDGLQFVIEPDEDSLDEKDKAGAEEEELEEEMEEQTVVPPKPVKAPKPVKYTHKPLLRSGTKIDNGYDHDLMSKKIKELQGGIIINLGGNSNKMTKFKSDLTMLTRALDFKMPIEQQTFEAQLEFIMVRYRSAVRSAEEYVESKESDEGKGPGFIGRKRLSLVKQILAQLISERRSFAAFARSMFERIEDMGEVRWVDVLKNARAIDIREGADSVKEIGAGSSILYRVTKTDEAGAQKQYFYKKEERMGEDRNDKTAMISAFRNTSPEYAMLINHLEALGEKYFAKKVQKKDERYGEYDFYDGLLSAISMVHSDWDKEDESLTKEQNLEAIMDRTAEYVKKDAEKNEFGKFIIQHFGDDRRQLHLLFLLGQYVGKKNVEYDNGVSDRTGAGADSYSTISDRNVSTSIAAKRLGVSDIVAESKTVLMRDQFGRAVRTNVMEGVEGIDAGDIYDYAKKLNKRVRFTPKALGMYFNLHVFDMICGQIDRHAGNFKLQFHEDEKEVIVDSVKGIDNDLSFGKMKFSRIEQNKSNMLFGFIHDGVYTLTYLTKSFYDAIQGYSDEMVDYDFIDTRTKVEIDAFKSRLASVKTILAKRVDEGSLRLVETPEQMEEAYREAEIYYANRNYTFFSRGDLTVLRQFNNNQEMKPIPTPQVKPGAKTAVQPVVQPEAK